MEPVSKLRELMRGPDALRRRLQEITTHLERIEDKLTRIEGGLEAAGILSKESRLAQRHLDPVKLSLEDSFDYIYLHRLWAPESGQSSGTGSYGDWAEKFVELVKDFVARYAIRSITDIGCGDFNVGSQLCPLVAQYNALDVSREIIRRNIERYRDLAHVTFRQANACADPLPVADLAIIRQVLQHLTNEQVTAILQNIERTGFRYVLIAEHVPADDKVFKPNLDLPGPSSAIRLTFGSGVFPDLPPFSRPVKRIAQYPGEGGQLVIFLWELGKKPEPAPAP